MEHVFLVDVLGIRQPEVSSDIDIQVHGWEGILSAMAGQASVRGVDGALIVWVRVRNTSSTQILHQREAVLDCNTSIRMEK